MECRLPSTVAICLSGRWVWQLELVKIFAETRLEIEPTMEVPVSGVTEVRVEALVTVWRTDKAVYWAVVLRSCGRAVADTVGLRVRCLGLLRGRNLGGGLNTRRLRSQVRVLGRCLGAPYLPRWP